MSTLGVIVQARMGSTRLPGKVLLPLRDRPVLWHVVDRLRACRTLQHIVVATSTLPEDDAIEQSLASYRPPTGPGESPVRVYRGPLDDVLARFVGAAQQYDLDPIVRVTADCPLIDPEIVDRVVSLFLEGGSDYASNVRFRRTFPRGLDTEVVSRACLLRMARLATTAAEREHVTTCIDTHRQAFVSRCLEHDRDLSSLRLTLDTPADYRLITLLYDELYDPGVPFSLAATVRLCEQNPELPAIVAHVQQKNQDRAG